MPPLAYTLFLLLAGLVGATFVEIPTLGSANLLEILWTLIGAGAFAFSLINLPRIIGDWQLAHVVVTQNTEAVMLVARAHVRREAIRLCQSLIILVIGIYGMAQPHPVPGPVLVTPVGLLITAGLFALGALIATQSVLDRRQRAAVERMLIEREENHAP